MNIDLNLSHYSTEDLYRFFDVKPNCTPQELVQKESHLLSRLIHISMEDSKKRTLNSLYGMQKQD